ncbi:hypothetical protein OHB25_56450 [Streptomyces mirabilis]|uniref:hypothetical protein n=1 Tax=Streptomyces mirabilis TaxID=68239 RepID=UPI001164CF73|nr:hypothetical protein [Streptomyces mirabilis]MCX4615676.1 hypothetical protein [Streptomyces mirabilis]MCX5355468.1 hypothetical protein [Streptomyces mirabilis]QDN93156.1 hypothetical protein FNV61_54150 [Streptomyces sp. RLB3-6]
MPRSPHHSQPGPNRYDQRIPPVTFHLDAKALLVVGLHADRRHVAGPSEANRWSYPSAEWALSQVGRAALPLCPGVYAGGVSAHAASVSLGRL